MRVKERLQGPAWERIKAHSATLLEDIKLRYGFSSVSNDAILLRAIIMYLNEEELAKQ